MSAAATRQFLSEHPNLKYVFFGGKGGVGKTVMAGTAALWLARQGKPHLIEIQGAQYEGVTVWFNTMLASLRQMKGDLEEWGRTLEQKIEEDRNQQAAILSDLTAAEQEKSDMLAQAQKAREEAEVMKREADDLALQVVKYQQRDRWSHGDLLRLAHPKAPSRDHEAVFRWILSGASGLGKRTVTRRVQGEPRVAKYAAVGELPKRIAVFEQAKRWQPRLISMSTAEGADELRRRLKSAGLTGIEVAHRWNYKLCITMS